MAPDYVQQDLMRPNNTQQPVPSWWRVPHVGANCEKLHPRNDAEQGLYN